MNASFQLTERPLTDAQLAQSNLRLRIGEHVIDMGALRIISRPDAPRLTSKAVAVIPGVLAISTNVGDLPFGERGSPFRTA